jgi:hypothetical protein
LHPSGSVSTPEQHATRVQQPATAPGPSATRRSGITTARGLPCAIAVLVVSSLLAPPVTGAPLTLDSGTQRHIVKGSLRDPRIATVSARAVGWPRKRHAHQVRWMRAGTCVPSRASRLGLADSVSVTPQVLEAVRQAIEVTKLDPVLLLTIARAESRFDPSARNRRSSARGLLQFTRDTWLEAVRQFGPRHGLAGYANAILSKRGGHLYTARPATLRAILRLRDDAQLSAVMAAERIAQQRLALQQVLGQEASVTDLYLLHVLGQRGVTRFLTALRNNPELPSVTVVGASTQPNSGLFMRGGCPLTVGQVYARISVQLLAKHAEYRPVLANLGASIAGSAP